MNKYLSKETHSRSLLQKLQENSKNITILFKRNQFLGLDNQPKIHRHIFFKTLSTKRIPKLAGDKISYRYQKTWNRVFRGPPSLKTTEGKFSFLKIKKYLCMQKLRVINRGITTKYFKLEKVARQRDPVSVYLFILCLEILLMLTKSNKGIKMFENIFLYTDDADDSTLFLKGKISVKELLNTINYFSSSSGLKPNLSKCTETVIGALKGVKVSICWMKCIDLTEKAIKILGVLFSYDKNLQLENYFGKTIVNIERVLKMWKRRNLKLKGKIIIFKTLALSKIILL